MIRSHCILAFLLVSSLWGAGTDAAEITVLPTSMGDLAVITIVGPLKLTDGDAFANVVSSRDSALIVFNSDGGNLLAGLRIGQLIRIRQFATLVPDSARCASACAIAWLGGTKRFMQSTALIGFHAAFLIENGIVTETGAGNALVGAYLSRLGLSDAAILYIEKAHPDQINWLTKKDAAEVGIEVAILPSLQSRSAPRQPAPEDQPRRVPRASPSTPPPLDQIATTFAEDYFAHWSETNTNALIYFGSVYAERVEFYGKLISRSVLIDQKRKFAERWPERVYTVRPSSVTTHCNDATATCTLEGIVDWDARNGEGGPRSAGSANFDLRVTIRHGTTTIYGEAGSVINRTITGP